MILTTADGTVYMAHFRHLHHDPLLNEANGKLYRSHTECSLHRGACRDQKRPCNSAGQVLGVAKCSILDHFDRHKGHFLAFRRALCALTANRQLRRELFTSYWAQVRKPVRKNHN